MPAVLGAIAGVVSAGSTLLGLGMQAKGNEQAMAAQQEMVQKNTEYNQQIITQENAANKVRQQAMELDAHRRSIEVIRSQNVARAMALTAATAGGAQGGSGLQGGYGTIAGQTSRGLAGISSSLDSGEQLFGIENQMNNTKYNYAGTIGPLQSSALAGAGMSSLGGAIINAGPALGRIGATVGGLFSGNNSGNIFGSGGYQSGGYTGSGINSGGMELNY